MLKRKDSNLQCTLAAVLPETKSALLLIYMACKHFLLSTAVSTIPPHFNILSTWLDSNQRCAFALGFADPWFRPLAHMCIKKHSYRNRTCVWTCTATRPIPLDERVFSKRNKTRTCISWIGLHAFYQVLLLNHPLYTEEHSSMFAGGEGFEPSTTVLETAMLPLHQPPIEVCPKAYFVFKEHCEYTNYF